MPPPPPSSSADEEAVAAESTKSKLLFALLCVILVFTIIDSLTLGMMPVVIAAYVKWTQQNAPASLVLYVFVVIVSVIACLPAGLLIAAAGALYTAVYGYAGGIALATVSMVFADVLSSGGTGARSKLK